MKKAKSPVENDANADNLTAVGQSAVIVECLLAKTLTVQMKKSYITRLDVGYQAFFQYLYSDIISHLQRMHSVTAEGGPWKSV
jgi:hypothetical protein